MSKLITFPCGAIARPNRLKHGRLRGFVAVGAGAVMLNDGARNLKPIRFTVSVIMRVPFFDRATGFANEELGQIALMAVITGDEGVKGLDAVNQA